MFFKMLFVQDRLWLFFLLSRNILINLKRSFTVFWCFKAHKMSCISLKLASLTFNFIIFRNHKSCYFIIMLINIKLRFFIVFLTCKNLFKLVLNVFFSIIEEFSSIFAKNTRRFWFLTIKKHFRTIFQFVRIT